MESTNELPKEAPEEPESKEESDQEEDDKKDAVKIDPNNVVLSEDEKARAREKFDMEDIDYDGQVDEQQCIKLLVGTRLSRFDSDRFRGGRGIQRTGAVS